MHVYTNRYIIEKKLKIIIILKKYCWFRKNKKEKSIFFIVSILEFEIKKERHANSQREAKIEIMKKFTKKLRKNKRILKYLMNMYAEIVA